MLYLKEANLEDAEKEYLFVRDLPPEENGFFNDWHGISREEFDQKALVQMMTAAKGENIPSGYVPQTSLFLWKEDTIVDLFRVRHYLNESLRNGAGHIGYGIQKEFRGKGYGTEGLRLTLQYAKSIVPEEEFYLRVNKDNPASLRVMLKNGGIIHSENSEHYFVRIKKEN